MAEPLKPCPFCGGSDVGLDMDFGFDHYVYCNGCRANGPETESEKAAIAAWNRREPEDA